MNRLLFACLVLGAVSTPTIAQEQAGAEAPEAWPDAQIWNTVLQTFGLKSSLREAVFDDPVVRSEIRRAGVSKACAEIADAVDEEADVASAWFRPAIIAEARRRVPAQPDFRDRISVSPQGYHFGGMMARIEREQGQHFAESRLSLRSRVTERLAALGSVEGEWRGMFADWNFDGRNATVWSSACMIEGLGNAASAKAPFDTFYIERDNQ